MKYTTALEKTDSWVPNGVYDIFGRSMQKDPAKISDQIYTQEAYYAL